MQLNLVHSNTNIRYNLRRAIASLGKHFFFRSYGGVVTNDIKDLNDLRYDRYRKITGSGRVKLESLPPTSHAAYFHSLRVYYQVQYWAVDFLEPEEKWGLKRSSRGLEPIVMTIKSAPYDLLRSISCKCKKKLWENLWLSESRSILFGYLYKL